MSFICCLALLIISFISLAKPSPPPSSVCKQSFNHRSFPQFPPSHSKSQSTSVKILKVKFASVETLNYDLLFQTYPSLETIDLSGNYELKNMECERFKEADVLAIFNCGLAGGGGSVCGRWGSACCCGRSGSYPRFSDICPPLRQAQKQWKSQQGGGGGGGGRKEEEGRVGRDREVPDFSLIAVKGKSILIATWLKVVEWLWEVILAAAVGVLAYLLKKYKTQLFNLSHSHFKVAWGLTQRLRKLIRMVRKGRGGKALRGDRPNATWAGEDLGGGGGGDETTAPCLMDDSQFQTAASSSFSIIQFKPQASSTPKH